MLVDVQVYSMQFAFFFLLFNFLSLLLITNAFYSNHYSLCRFRHLVQQLYDASQLTRDWAGTVSSTLAIRVRRDHLLLDSIDLLKQVSNLSLHSFSPLLANNRNSTTFYTVHCSCITAAYMKYVGSAQAFGRDFSLRWEWEASKCFDVATGLAQTTPSHHALGGKHRTTCGCIL